MADNSLPPGFEYEQPSSGGSLPAASLPDGFEYEQPSWGRTALNALTEGAYLAAGLPGELTQGAADLGRWAGNKTADLLGAPPLKGPLPPAQNPLPLPTATDLEKTAGFQPLPDQPGWKGAMQEGLRAAPSAVLMGGGALPALAKEGVGAALKAGAGDVVRYATIPGAAGSAAGQMFGPAAKAATEIVTSGITGLAKPAASLGAESKAAKAAAAASQYANPILDATLVKPESFDNFVTSLKGSREFAEPFGLDDSQVESRKALNWISSRNDFIQNDPNSIPPSLANLERIRQSINNHLDTAVTAGNDADARKLSVMKKEWDNYVNNLDPAKDIISGDPKAAADALNAARANWTLKSKADILDGAMRRATNSAAANNLNMLDAVKAQFRTIANKDYLYNQFSPDEQKVIDEIVQGTTGEKLARTIGKFAPHGPFGILVNIGALHLGGLPALASVTGPSEVARMMATNAMMRRQQMLNEMMRAPGSARPSIYPGVGPAGGMGLFYGLNPDQTSTYVPATPPQPPVATMGPRG